MKDFSQEDLKIPQNHIFKTINSAKSCQIDYKTAKRLVQCVSRISSKLYSDMVVRKIKITTSVYIYQIPHVN